MISKDLFVAVMPEAQRLLNQDGYEFETFRFDDYDNTIRATISKINGYVCDYGTGIHCPVNINIYELAHKCKEWAFNEGYSILIDILGIDNYQISMEQLKDGKPAYVKDLYNTTEPKAIFLACQWILDNKETK